MKGKYEMKGVVAINGSSVLAAASVTGMCCDSLLIDGSGCTIYKDVWSEGDTGCIVRQAQGRQVRKNGS